MGGIYYATFNDRIFRLQFQLLLHPLLHKESSSSTFNSIFHILIWRRGCKLKKKAVHGGKGKANSRKCLSTNEKLNERSFRVLERGKKSVIKRIKSVFHHWHCSQRHGEGKQTFNEGDVERNFIRRHRKYNHNEFNWYNGFNELNKQTISAEFTI